MAISKSFFVIKWWALYLNLILFWYCLYILVMLCWLVPQSLKNNSTLIRYNADRWLFLRRYQKLLIVFTKLCVFDIFSNTLFLKMCVFHTHLVYFFLQQYSWRGKVNVIDLKFEHLKCLQPWSHEILIFCFRQCHINTVG